MPQISPISWMIVLLLLTTLLTSTSTQIPQLPTKSPSTQPITTKEKPTKW